jgi:hypothetical protein
MKRCTPFSTYKPTPIAVSDDLRVEFSTLSSQQLCIYIMGVLDHMTMDAHGCLITWAGYTQDNCPWAWPAPVCNSHLGYHDPFVAPHSTICHAITPHKDYMKFEEQLLLTIHKMAPENRQKLLVMEWDIAEPSPEYDISKQTAYPTGLSVRPIGRIVEVPTVVEGVGSNVTTDEPETVHLVWHRVRWFVYPISNESRRDGLLSPTVNGIIMSSSNPDGCLFLHDDTVQPAVIKKLRYGERSRSLLTNRRIHTAVNLMHVCFMTPTRRSVFYTPTCVLHKAETAKLPERLIDPWSLPEMDIYSNPLHWCCVRVESVVAYQKEVAPLVVRVARRDITPVAYRRVVKGVPRTPMPSANVDTHSFNTAPHLIDKWEVLSDEQVAGDLVSSVFESSHL